MKIPESLPLLSAGHHPRGSGNACIMDAISYISGDSEVTDMPKCVYPVLAKMAQRLNDTICNHNEGRKLCSSCSRTMWMIGQRVMGSSSAVEGLDLARLNVRLAIAAAISVLDFTGPLKGRSLTAINAAELWLSLDGNAARAAGDAAGNAARAARAAARAIWNPRDNVGNTARAAGNAAGDAAWAAARAAWAAGAAAWDAAGTAAGDAAWAARNAARAAGSAEPLLTVIEEFERATGFNVVAEFGSKEYKIVREGARI